MQGQRPPQPQASPGQAAPRPSASKRPAAAPKRPTAAPKRPTAAPKRKGPPPMTPAQQRLWKQMKKRQRKQAFVRFRFYAVGTLAAYAVLALIFALVILIKLQPAPQKEQELPGVFFADAEQDRFSADLKGTHYSAERLREENLLYLELDLLTHYTPLSESGNTRLRAVHLNGETALFYVGTTSVYLNGQHTTLSAPCILRNSRLCVPLDFFGECLKGLQLSADSEKKRFVIEQTGSLGFVLQEDRPMDPIPYEALLSQASATITP